MPIDTLIKIFGGQQRIDRLAQHFEALLQASIEISILSYLDLQINLLRTALGRIHLFKYFDHSTIISGEQQVLHRQNIESGHVVKAMAIQDVFGKKINLNQILFVDDDRKSAREVGKSCKTFVVKPRCGLNESHLISIEKMAGVQAKHVKRRKPLESKKKSMANQLNS